MNILIYKTSNIIGYLVVVVIALSLYYKFGLAVLISVLLVVGLVLLQKYKPQLLKIDIVISLYFIWTSVFYMTYGIDIKYYNAIILFPILLYSLGSVKFDYKQGLVVIKLLLLIVFVYSILSFFREADGSFSLSLTNNIYLNQRTVEDNQLTEDIRFFRNATLMSLWLVTTFVFSLCLYNNNKNRIYFIIMVVMAMLIFLSNTRSAIGATIVIIVINHFYVKRYGFNGIVKLSIVIIPLLFLTINYLGSNFTFQQERLMEIFVDSESRGLGYRSTVYWSLALFLFIQNFWGYGHLYVIENYGFSTHNEILGQLVAVGLFPTILLFVFIFYHLYLNYKKSINNNINNTIWSELSLYLIIAYFIVGITEHISLGNYYWVAIMFYVIGCSKTIHKNN
jgi:hypothetical protein